MLRMVRILQFPVCFDETVASTVPEIDDNYKILYVRYYTCQRQTGENQQESMVPSSNRSINYQPTPLVSEPRQLQLQVPFDPLIKALATRDGMILAGRKVFCNQI